MHLPNQYPSAAITLNGYSSTWSPLARGVTLSSKCDAGEYECSCPNGESICCPDICACACSSTQGFPFCTNCA